jgi:hypothetical protein
MMASEIQVANSALIAIGEKRVTAIDARARPGASSPISSAISRDKLMRSFRWNFAMKRALLPPSADTPEWGFDYQYELPPDFLALDMVNDVFVGLDMSDYRNSDASEYSLEGRSILTNISAPLKIRYIRQVLEVGLWDASFVSALALQLGLDCCEKITQSTSKKESIRADLREASAHGDPRERDREAAAAAARRLLDDREARLMPKVSPIQSSVSTRASSRRGWKVAPTSTSTTPAATSCATSSRWCRAPPSAALARTWWRRSSKCSIAPGSCPSRSTRSRAT